MSRFTHTILALCLVPTAAAQMQVPGARTVRGEVDGMAPGEHVFVELYAESRLVDKAAVMPDGAFDFRGIADGNYEVRVTDAQGETLRREWVHIADHTGPLALKLPKRNRDRPAGSVSLRRLANPAPKAARKELERAQRAVDKGLADEAVAHLRKAIEIHPEYVEARNNLGVRLMQREEHEAALAEFRAAAAIDPGAAQVSANMALALIHLKRHGEAEAPARTAVRADPANPAARYALGIAVAVHRGPSEEAIGHLRAAAYRFPRAHLAIAHMLASWGRRADAAAELRAYLGAAEATQRSAVESWLRALGPPGANALR